MERKLMSQASALSRNKAGFRLRLYRGFQRLLAKSFVLPLFFSKRRRSEAFPRDLRDQAGGGKRAGSGGECVWFHAASVGELESIWTLIEATARQGSDLVVTVFSESARGHLERLEKAIRSYPGRIRYLGYSPWEGEWSEALLAFGATKFVTAKYEAWPDLWLSLGEQGIGLAIIGARARKSLKLGFRFPFWLGGQLPEIEFLAVDRADAAALEKVYPTVRCEVVGEPRWDRVAERAKAGSERARELIEVARRISRPHGILAQVWPEDLPLWNREVLSRSNGFFWIVPHRLDPPILKALEKAFLLDGKAPVRTSRLGKKLALPEGTRCAIVDEMGVLLELYSAVDWAYVGGGFGKGVHSTIEPAIFGLPVCIGPNGAGKFPEVADLLVTGQLTLIRDSAAAGAWLSEAIGPKGQEKRDHWLKDAGSRLGATERIFSKLFRS